MMGLSEIIEGTAVSAIVSTILSAFLSVYIGIFASLIFSVIGVIGILLNIGDLMDGITVGGIIILVLNLIFYFGI